MKQAEQLGRKRLRGGSSSSMMQAQGGISAGPQ